MKKFISLLMIPLILFAMLTACGPEDEPEQMKDNGNDASQTADATPAQDIGQGGNMFVFEVTDDDGAVTVWNVHTDEATVGAALLDLGLIDGEVSMFGLYVKEVSGLIADYDVNQSWWAFYIDGEMAMAGVDSVNIENGKTYAFIYTIG